MTMTKRNPITADMIADDRADHESTLARAWQDVYAAKRAVHLDSDDDNLMIAGAALATYRGLQASAAAARDAQQAMATTEQALRDAIAELDRMRKEMNAMLELFSWTLSPMHLGASAATRKAIPSADTASPQQIDDPSKKGSEPGASDE